VILIKYISRFLNDDPNIGIAVRQLWDFYPGMKMFISISDYNKDY